MEFPFFLFKVLFTAVPLFILVFFVLVIIGIVSGIKKHRRVTDEFAERGFKARPSQRMPAQDAPAEKTPHSFDLQCDHCGAKLSDASEISPHGDVKCEYCKKWFNVKT